MSVPLNGVFGRYTAGSLYFGAAQPALEKGGAVKQRQIEMGIANMRSGS